MPHFAIRTDRYKRVRFYGEQGVGSCLTYKTRPHELRGICTTQSYVDVGKKLKERLVELVGRYGGQVAATILWAD